MAEKPNPTETKKAPSKRVLPEGVTPTAPADYTPKGKVRVLSELGGVRVVCDDVRTWKEAAE